MKKKHTHTNAHTHTMPINIVSFKHKRLISAYLFTIGARGKIAPRKYQAIIKSFVTSRTSKNGETSSAVYRDKINCN